jgi:hypothetical protein
LNVFETDEWARIDSAADHGQVQWAIQNDVESLAQTGSHGWTTSWNLGDSGVLINLRGLNNVAVNLKEGCAIIEAGALVGEVINAAYAAKAHLGASVLHAIDGLVILYSNNGLTEYIVVGNCNSVGACGAMLGGGFSRLQANYSMSIDNVISLRLVTGKGDMITVSPTENVELLWGLKGAGHNFGIVTAAKVNAFPQINNGIHWESTMVFLPDHIEELTQTINDLDMGEGMSIHYAFTGLPPFGFVCDPLFRLALVSHHESSSANPFDFPAGGHAGTVVCRYAFRCAKGLCSSFQPKAYLPA